MKRKPTHRCPGCGDVHIGKREVLCFDCQPSRDGGCIECGDPVKGRSKRCPDCRAHYTADYQRERYMREVMKDPAGKRAAVAAQQRRYYRTDKGKEQQRKKDKARAARRRMKRIAAGATPRSDEARAKMAAAHLARWARIRAERVYP